MAIVCPSRLCDERNAAVLLLKFKDVFVLYSACVKRSFTFSISILYYSKNLMKELLLYYKLVRQLLFSHLGFPPALLIKTFGLNDTLKKI